MGHGVSVNRTGLIATIAVSLKKHRDHDQSSHGNRGNSGPKDYGWFNDSNQYEYGYKIREEQEKTMGAKNLETLDEPLLSWVNGDTDAKKVSGLRQAIASVFGNGKSIWHGEEETDLQDEERTNFFGEKIGWIVNKKEMESAVKSQYDFTQKKIKEDFGDQKTIKLFRGVYTYDGKEPAHKSGVDTIESWTDHEGGAAAAWESRGYTRNNYILEEKEFSVKDIFAYPGSSWNLRRMPDEREFIIINRNDDKIAKHGDHDQSSHGNRQNKVESFSKVPQENYSINGSVLAHAEPVWPSYQDKNLGESPMPDPPSFQYRDKNGALKQVMGHQSAGVIMVEPDGRIWLTAPKGKWAGYENTFPKGSINEGESPQKAAIREVYEETGLNAEISDVLGDYRGSESVTRFYIGRRVSGAPWDAGEETEEVKLVPRLHAVVLLNAKRDHKVLLDLKEKISKRSAIAKHADHDQSSHGNRGNPPDPKNLKKISGKLGANPGGWYQDKETGKKYYVKFYEDPEKANVEALTNKMLGQLGVNTPNSHVLKVEGKQAFISEEIPNKKDVFEDTVSGKEGFEKAFIPLAFLANRDLFGQDGRYAHGVSNVVESDGKYYFIDNGGSMYFRGLQGKKDFGEEVVEVEGFLKFNEEGKIAFKGINKEKIRAQVKELEKTMTDEYIESVVKEFDVGKPDRLIKTLKGRRDWLVKNYGEKHITKTHLGVMTILKFNPYRDEKGRFASASGGSFSKIKYSSLKADAKSTYKKNFDNEQISALDNYTGDGAFHWNKQLRNSKTTPHGAKKLDELMKKYKLPKNTYLYRGLSWVSNVKVEGIVGKTLIDKGFISTSTNKGSASHFAGYGDEYEEGEQKMLDDLDDLDYKYQDKVSEIKDKYEYEDATKEQKKVLKEKLAQAKKVYDKKKESLEEKYNEYSSGKGKKAKTLKGKSVLVKIAVPKGTNAIVVDAALNSGDIGSMTEDEVILPRNSIFKVIGYKPPKNGHHRLYLKYVGVKK